MNIAEISKITSGGINEVFKLIISGKSFVHPEQQEDEIYLGDHTSENIRYEWGWKTTRLGKFACDSKGNSLPDSSERPTFIKRTEVESELRECERWGALNQVKLLRSMLNGTWVNK